MPAHEPLVAGLVLHRRAYRETSFLLEIFTRPHGRVGVVARGARRRRGADALQPFERYLFGWRGAGELPTLTSWERESGAVLAGTALVSGLYLNELLVRLLERQDPHPELYDAYVEALDELGAPADAAQREATLRTFEVRLLAALGFGMELSHEAGSGVVLRHDARYCYEHEVGPVLVQTGDPRPTLRGASLLALRDGVFQDEQQRQEAKRLMRALINNALEGRPLISRTLLRGA